MWIVYIGSLCAASFVILASMFDGWLTIIFFAIAIAIAITIFHKGPAYIANRTTEQSQKGA